jgi:periplasmic copper chaperone A
MHKRIFAIGLCAAWLAAPALALAPLGPARHVPLHVLDAAMAAAGPVKIGSLIIEAPWIRATAPGVTVAGGFLRITNAGSDADRLVGIEAPFADHVQIHQSSKVGDVMQMRPLAEGLEIDPGQTVELKPGSYHLMFLGVKEPIEQGSSVKATLEFAKSGKIAVEFVVVAPGAGPPQDVPAH